MFDDVGVLGNVAAEQVISIKARAALAATWGYWELEDKERATQWAERVTNHWDSLPRELQGEFAELSGKIIRARVTKTEPKVQGLSEALSSLSAQMGNLSWDEAAVVLAYMIEGQNRGTFKGKEHLVAHAAEGLFELAAGWSRPELREDVFRMQAEAAAVAAQAHKDSSNWDAAEEWATKANDRYEYLAESTITKLGTLCAQLATRQPMAKEKAFEVLGKAVVGSTGQDNPQPPSAFAQTSQDRATPAATQELSVAYAFTGCPFGQS